MWSITESPNRFPLCIGQGDIVSSTVGQVFSPGELLVSVPHIFSLSASAFLVLFGGELQSALELWLMHAFPL